MITFHIAMHITLICVCLMSTCSCMYSLSLCLSYFLTKIIVLCMLHHKTWLLLGIKHSLISNMVNFIVQSYGKIYVMCLT